MIQLNYDIELYKTKNNKIVRFLYKLLHKMHPKFKGVQITFIDKLKRMEHEDLEYLSNMIIRKQDWNNKYIYDINIRG